MKKMNNNKKVSNLENLLFIRLEEYTRKGWKGNGLINIYDDMMLNTLRKKIFFL